MIQRMFSGMMGVFCLTIFSLSAVQTHLVKSFHHTAESAYALELGKIVLYFDKKPELMTVADRTINSAQTIKTIFIPESSIDAEVNSFKGDAYSVTVEQGTYRDRNGLYLSIDYDPRETDVIIDTSTAITRQPIIIITFLNTKYLNVLKNSTESPILTTVHHRPPTIIIDAGHGGSDKGAIGCSGVFEKEITLSMGRFLENECIERGWQVIMTRSNDTFVPLGERTHYAQQSHADYFISIHANYASNSQAQGIETFSLDRSLFLPLHSSTPGSRLSLYHSASDNLCILSKKLADSVHSSLITNIKKNYDLVDRKVKSAVSQVLIGSQIPSILIEIGFLSNSDECRQLMDTNYQQLAAHCIANGINNFYNSNNRN